MKLPYEPSDKAVTELRSHGNESELSSSVNIPFLLQFSIQFYMFSLLKNESVCMLHINMG